jgi:hypothetical protein
MRKKSIMTVIGPNIHAIHSRVGGCFSGLMKFGGGKLSKTSGGGLRPPGILKV